MKQLIAHLGDESAHQLVVWIKEWSSSRVIVLTHHGALPVSVDEVFCVSAGHTVVNRNSAFSAQTCR